MIQRKQTLFLLLAVIASVCCLFLPIASVEPEGMGGGCTVYNLGLVSGEGGISLQPACIPLFTLLSVTTILSLVTIFLYKNRKLQMQLCSIALLFGALWYVDYILLYVGVVPVADGEMRLQFAACLPLVSLVLIWMGKKGVCDDEKLVRAADRIR